MASLKKKIAADVAHTAGSGNKKSVFRLFFTKKAIRIIILFRILNHYYYCNNKIASLLLIPVRIYYRLMTNRYCVDLSYKTRIGQGLKLNHAYCIVVNERVQIGENVYIGHNVTIGSSGPANVPKIGNNVTVFVGSIIIGNVSVGDNVVVGAGSLVVRDIPANSVVGGHPCHTLKSS
jgi:serine acetyltransferase